MEKSGAAPSRRLSALDAAFIYLERKEIPLNVAGLLVFDGPIPFEEFVANIESKLPLMPRYTQIVAAPPMNIGYPVWEDAPNFDIREHIIRTKLRAPGGDAELEELAGRLYSKRMDRSKPLWQLHVVEGLNSGRGALFVILHHALADGIAGMELVRLMLDPTPEGSRTVRKMAAPPPSPPADRSVGKALARAVYNTLDKLIGAEEGLLEILTALPTQNMRTGILGAMMVLPELLTAVERLPFNKPCSGERKFCWADFDFADVQAIRTVTGGTLNDLVLSMLARAIARYVEAHRETTKNRLVRVICPVNLRHDSGETLGNRISFMPVVLPLDVKDPVAMVHAVVTRMEIMKRAKAAEALAVFANCLGAAPPPFQWMFWRGLPNVILPVPLFNIICTNIPGSREPLYAVGRRMVACYPQVPTGYELGVGCAVQTYAGKLCFGLVADAHVVPDVRRLRDYLNEAFEELRVAAGVTGAPKAKPAPKKAAAASRKRKPVKAAVEAPRRVRRARKAKPAPAEPETAAPVPEAAPELAVAETAPVAAEAAPAAPAEAQATRRPRARRRATAPAAAAPETAAQAELPVEPTAEPMAAGARAGQ